MKQRARKNLTPRVWTQETAYTCRIAARIPLDLAARLRRYTEEHNSTTTDTVIRALDQYLRKETGE